VATILTRGGVWQGHRRYQHDQHRDDIQQLEPLGRRRPRRAHHRARNPRDAPKMITNTSPRETWARNMGQVRFHQQRHFDHPDKDIGRLG
jgi:hypothetical protein